jgi:hypothetical protein
MREGAATVRAARFKLADKKAQKAKTKKTS